MVFESGGSVLGRKCTLTSSNLSIQEIKALTACLMFNCSLGGIHYAELWDKKALQEPLVPKASYAHKMSK